MPEPTHDFDRDVGSARERRHHYDLTATEDRPDVIATNPMRRAGHGPAQKVVPDNIGRSGNALVIARSGNQGWDEDTFEAVGGVEDEGTPDIPCLGEDRSGNDPGMPIAKVVLPIALGVLVYFLFFDKNRIR
jgi:hypothetical protein